MAQFYTLEEAARVLGMGPDDLKTKAQHREVRAFMDGGSWRFRVADIDELARRRGLGSDPELSLSDLDLAVPEGSGSDELDLSEFQLGTAPADLGNRTVDLDISGASDDDHDVEFNDLSLPPGPLSNSSSTIIGMKGNSNKQPSDSDVRLMPDKPYKDASDSDVRLMPFEKNSPKPPSDSDVTLITEDASIHNFNALSGSSDNVRASGGPIGSSDEVSSMDADSGSDFELMPSSDIAAALQPESGSDFELTALDASDEFEATPMAGPNDSDVTAAQPGLSGLNLARPSDSGINLQSVGGFDLSQADSIELTPLDDDDDLPAKPAPKPAAAKTPTVKPADPGATAMGAVDKDIFEDTDFSLEVDDQLNDDRTVQLERGSDFDLEDSDSASEVFALDEDDVDLNAATAMAPAVLDEGGAEFDSDDAPSGEIDSAWDVEGDAPAAAAATAASAGPRLVAAGPQAEWGGIWVGLLGVTSVMLLVSAFISMDLINNLYELRGDGAASGLIKSIAGLLG